MSTGKYVFSKGLKEVRFHFCQTGQQSQAVRSFLVRAYPVMKKHNPSTPVLIREAQGVEPKVWARYEFGKEKMEPLTGLDEKAIEGKVTDLIKAMTA